MKEYDCENTRCPMNEQSAIDKRDRICKAPLEIWSRCMRWQPYVPPKPKKEEEKKED